MIRETITFNFDTAEQQRRFHDRLEGVGRLGVAITRIGALELALTRLTNEVLGSLPLVEPLARREMGNTNYALLIQRAEEARKLLTELAPRRHKLPPGACPSCDREKSDFHPSHDASARCESGKHSHCSCDTCF